MILLIIVSHKAVVNSVINLIFVTVNSIYMI